MEQFYSSAIAMHNETFVSKEDVLLPSTAFLRRSSCELEEMDWARQNVLDGWLASQTLVRHVQFATSQAIKGMNVALIWKSKMSWS